MIHCDNNSFSPLGQENGLDNKLTSIAKREIDQVGRSLLLETFYSRDRMSH